MPTRRLTFPAVFAATLLAITISGHAQSADPKPSDCSKLPSHREQSDCASVKAETKTFYLANVTNQNDANEIMVAVRNVVNDADLRIYLVSSENALVVKTYPEEMSRIEALIQTLDHPRKTYRLTYTITELDAGKTIGTEHLSMVLVAGQHTTLKQGDKIPVATGSFSSENPSAGSQTQFQYLDVGMNIDATITEYGTGVFLKSKVEQSSLGQPSTIAGIQEPVVRQTVVEGTAVLTPAKPVMLGTVDVPNSTHHFDIAVVMDPIK
jgi:type II secretory pathway component GspD/PulD (secretin)